MAPWYKHDIAAWMDGTEELDDGPYRVYHVICQLIYLSEGPIRFNENGIAGRCKQSVRAFQKHIAVLIEYGYLQLENGRLSNSRARKEIEKMGINRENAAMGGKAKAKSLENKEPELAPLKGTFALRLEETRLEETRNKDGAEAPIVNLFPKPDSPPSEEKSYYDRSKEILGPKGNGLAAKLLKSQSRVIAKARAVIETASTKSDPAAYIGAVIRGGDRSDMGAAMQAGYGDDWF